MNSEFMDNPVQEYRCSGPINLFGFDHVLIPAVSDQNHVNGLEFSDRISDHHMVAFLPDGPESSSSAPSSWASSEEGNVSDALLKYISEVLMEDEDFESKPSVSHDSLALQEAEKSLFDVLGEKYTPSPDHGRQLIHENVEDPDDGFARNKYGSSLVQSSYVHHRVDFVMESNLVSFGASSSFCDAPDGTLDSLVNSLQVLDPSKGNNSISQFRGGEGRANLRVPKEDYENRDLEQNWKENLSCGSRGTKSHHREDDNYLEAGRTNKQLASYAEDSVEESEMYDKVLLCPDLNAHLQKDCSGCLSDEVPRNEASRKLLKNGQAERSSGRRPRGKKQSNGRKVVDLMALLIQCAHAVASNDSKTVNELLEQVRQHSSPRGNGNERMAHYVANALETRLAGTGRALGAALMINRLSTADTLKAYLSFIKASPFNAMAHFFANKLIYKQAANTTRLHIIDFGIIHGFQWPILLQNLSTRPGGPPRVRITGIDFPQPGFRPAERVEETGHRLAYYCRRFNVPFEYNSVAKKWDTIRLEDLKIQRDEMLLVNCLFRLRYIPDETVEENSPRDAVLGLIKRINPDLFIHGIVNGTYSGPFFVPRFREVLYQSGAVFDMFDAILTREDQGRMLFEEEVFGRGMMSTIACEGTERVIRPEKYKQWQIRNARAGLRQLPLDQEIMKRVKAKVTLDYHKDFLVDEDSNWMLLGWRGRILSALSSWKPAQEMKV